MIPGAWFHIQLAKTFKAQRLQRCRSFRDVYVHEMVGLSIEQPQILVRV